MKNLKVGRVVLNSKSTDDLNYIIEDLKKDGPYMKGGPSDLVSFIISEFRQKFFEKEKAVLKNQFFDNKSYVKDRILKSKSEDEFYEEMKAVLKERDKTLKKNRLKTNFKPLKAQKIEVYFSAFYLTGWGQYLLIPFQYKSILISELKNA